MTFKDFQNVKFKHEECTASTNDIARELCEKDCITVVTADEQTAGRGRMGRKFYSPKGSGLYMSLAFNREFFDISPEKTGLITPAAAVAVVTAIRETAGADSKIKWVNDIYMNGKKVCGILAEADLENIVVGIGVNVLKTSFPPELEEMATSMETEGAHTDKKALAEKIVEKFLALLENLNAEEIIPCYRKHSLLIGRDIDVYKNGYPTAENPNPASAAAKAVDVDSDGGLIVEYSDGTRETLISGEVTIRGMKQPIW